ncbi:MAG: hypothetical protein J0H59_17860 [Comamonadaceae bacterium]|nr:hypothetical protein [Comamonadaceae bacterium]
MTPDEYDEFLKKAFEAYLRVRAQEACQPSRAYLPYNVVDLSAPRWSAMGDMLIKDELRELTNILNAWLGTLRHWHAWLTVSQGYSDEDTWQLEYEFIAPLATYCLFQPSAIRDTFTFVVTNGMHQVLLATDSSYKDRLILDQAPWEERKYPTRRKKEEQLASVINRWPKGRSLLDNLRRLDDGTTRDATSDFRNRSSHSIAPRFSRGTTRMVTRTIEQATRMERRADGGCEWVPVSGKTAVCYGFGGTEPLDLDQVRQVNLAQFDIAVACFDLYLALLTKTTAARSSA